MAELETPAVESAQPPEVQAQAEKMGWIPPSRFRGDPERFVDADVYIERGETVLPIVKEQNKRLHAEVEGLRAESAKTAAALKAAGPTYPPPTSLTAVITYGRGSRPLSAPITPG